VLLIVRVLTPRRLGELLAAARAVGLDALVEIHGAGELDSALAAGARVIGVNSRDLDSLRIDVEAAWRLIERVPSDRIAVAESGMTTVADVEHAARAGADAVLIGTALSRAADPGAATRALAAVTRHER
jgi:indole-3-glycerol phosphate synthase